MSWFIGYFAVTITTVIYFAYKYFTIAEDMKHQIKMIDLTKKLEKEFEGKVHEHEQAVEALSRLDHLTWDNVHELRLKRKLSGLSEITDELSSGSVQEGGSKLP